MALGMRPTDALVHRLLQQSQQTSAHSHSGQNSKTTASKHGGIIDQVSISPEAKLVAESRKEKTSSQVSTAQSKYGQQDLEARLLTLYSHNTKG